MERRLLFLFSVRPDARGLKAARTRVWRCSKSRAAAPEECAAWKAGGSADINSIGGINGGAAGPAEWNSATPGPYDDFGTPIPGVTLPTVYFQFDSSRISSSEAPKLDEIAAYLMSNPGTGVVVEGNCDSRGSDEYNRALGERRALSAKEYLTGKGVAESRIRTISYGEERPAVQGEDEASRAKNRRDEFVAVTLRK